MKRLVVCCDGTWNAADSSSAETNVFRLAKAIHATHGQTGTQQIVLYLRGVGTTGLKVGDIIEGALGFGIDDNIRSAYMFLAQNYVPGDEIFLFGFSRGAFTARSLVGFIQMSGLLKRENLDQIHKAWDVYRLNDTGAVIADGDAHKDVPIQFVGVWDTVGALGVPGHLFSDIDAKNFGFHHTDVCPNVRHGCHALAIDEHRDAFVPALWTGALPAGTTIDQTWFAGAHSDVGGGYQTRALADIPLGWMAKHAEDDHLEIDWGSLAALSHPLDALAPAHDSRTLTFAYDKLRPTWRQVCGQPFDVELYERLYQPMDKNKKILPTINERLHASVIARFGNADAMACEDDTAGKSTKVIYEPKSIAGFAGRQPALVDTYAWPTPGPAG